MSKVLLIFPKTNLLSTHHNQLTINSSILKMTNIQIVNPTIINNSTNINNPTVIKNLNNINNPKIINNLSITTNQININNLTITRSQTNINNPTIINKLTNKNNPIITNKTINTNSQETRSPKTLIWVNQVNRTITNNRITNHKPMKNLNKIPINKTSMLLNLNILLSRKTINLQPITQKTNLHLNTKTTTQAKPPNMTPNKFIPIKVTAK
jgi:hypothetical protein